jgi:hypothetical protein
MQYARRAMEGVDYQNNQTGLYKQSLMSITSGGTPL